MRILARFQNQSKSEGQPQKNPKYPSWRKGQISGNRITCVQIDGVWKQNKDNTNWEAAITWSEEGEPNKFEALKVLASSPIQTEEQGLHYCLKSWQGKTKAIVIKIDCRELIMAFLKENQADVAVRNTLCKIKDIASHFDFICCTNVKRSEVFRADLLATNARKEA